jgi:hypothetical protein
MQSQYADSLDMLRNSLNMLRLSLNTPRVSLQDTDINPDMQTQRLNMLRLSPGSIRLHQADRWQNQSLYWACANLGPVLQNLLRPQLIS